MKKISCIIPTYNEEPRIKNVLEIVANHPLIDEIIVVDDGSIDNTQNIVKKFENVKLIVHSKNQGKSMAIYTGVRESNGEFIFLLDADLLGLTSSNIATLIEPVSSGIADISISLRRNTPWVWKLIGIDYISGERVFPKKMLKDNLEKIRSLPGFGLEIFINNVIIANKYRIKIVKWNNVDSPYKHKKHGFWIGIKGEFKMYKHIFKTAGILGPIYQIIKMLHLKV